jgi:hypothetical protein
MATQLLCVIEFGVGLSESVERALGHKPLLRPELGGQQQHKEGVENIFKGVGHLNNKKQKETPGPQKWCKIPLAHIFLKDTPPPFERGQSARLGKLPCTWHSRPYRQSSPQLRPALAGGDIQRNRRFMS